MQHYGNIPQQKRSQQWTQLKNSMKYKRANFELMKDEFNSLHYVKECYMILKENLQPSQSTTSQQSASMEILEEHHLTAIRKRGHI
ncbi:hypothetical protein FHG87_024499 [Trinorchestia longiramus]|nr:hypothetical protein FHG87_024499 [Trinorchestia longiramus]